MLNNNRCEALLITFVKLYLMIALLILSCYNTFERALTHVYVLPVNASPQAVE